MNKPQHQQQQCGSALDSVNAEVQELDFSRNYAPPLEKARWLDWRRKWHAQLWMAALLTMGLQPKRQTIKTLQDHYEALFADYRSRLSGLCANYGQDFLLPQISHPMEGEKLREKVVNLSNLCEFVAASEEASPGTWGDVGELFHGLGYRAALVSPTEPVTIPPVGPVQRQEDERETEGARREPSDAAADAQPGSASLLEAGQQQIERREGTSDHGELSGPAAEERWGAGSDGDDDEHRNDQNWCLGDVEKVPKLQLVALTLGGLGELVNDWVKSKSRAVPEAYMWNGALNESRVAKEIVAKLSGLDRPSGKQITPGKSVQAFRKSLGAARAEFKSKAG